MSELKTYPERERSLRIGAVVVTVVVLLLVGLMRQVKLPIDIDLSFLPAVNASINALTALALVASLYFIKRRNLVAHRNANLIALGLSVVFLGSYVAYHFTQPEVIFGDANGDGVLAEAEKTAVAGSRKWYLLLLISHIGLAGLILPFILFTTINAIAGHYDRHRRMARYVWPLWFYVTVTGPLVYWCLRDYYPQ